MEENLYSEFKEYYEEIYLEEKFNLGEICTGIKKNTEQEVFIKIYSKKLLKKGKYEYLLKQIEREVELSNLCKSEHILKVYKKLENQNAILLEYESFNMDLNKYQSENGELMYEEEFFKKIIRELANALKVLYNKKVIHRDIKPNNIFLVKKDINSEDYTIKLGNFSSSILLKENDYMQIGTILYTPPEMFKNLEYNEKVDLWSLGITLYYLYMGYSPYGDNVNLNLIKHSLYDKNFLFIFSENTCLNILFKKLMTINPKDRMTYDEFFEYVFDNNFMTQNFKNDKYKIINKEIEEIKSSEKYKKFLENKSSNEHNNVNLELCNDILILKKNLEKIVDIVRVDNLPNLMDFSRGDLNENTEFNNILYYDENVDNYLEEINEDSDLFEDNTLGTFLLCTKIDSLNLVLKEIEKECKKDSQLKFNLIVTGSKCEKVMNNLKEKKCEGIFENICIYCMDKEKYLPLKKKNKKIYDIYDDPSKVIEFIKKFSSKNIKPFRATKLVTLEEYKIYYYYWHKIVSIFYGDQTKETFKIYFDKMGDLINKEDKNKTLASINKNILLKGFKEFNIKEDLNELDKRIIKGYTDNTYYGDINKWLMNFSISSFQEVAYFTSRLMFSLNHYAQEEKKFFIQNEKILFRGTSIPYSSLLAYERAKGKIIILSAFTSSSESYDVAEEWSGRRRKKKEYDGSFSVIFYITNIWKDGWISNGIDIQELSLFTNEKEVLFQPFTFCYVKDVKFNLEKYTADIYLETVGKTEILEDAIKKGKKLKYNKSLNIIQIEQ